MRRAKRSILVILAVAVVGIGLWQLSGISSGNDRRVTADDVETLLGSAAGLQKLTCEMIEPSDNGIGRWTCTQGGESGGEASMIEVTVESDGSYSSRATGVPAIGGCCIGSPQ